MFKVAMIGAGSVVFVKNLLTDILDLPELREVTIALHDIDAERLETAGMMARWTAEQFGANAKVEEHLDRRAASMVRISSSTWCRSACIEATLLDFEIPRKYGLQADHRRHLEHRRHLPRPAHDPVHGRHGGATCASFARTRCCSTTPTR